MMWFTADHHFFHERIIEYCGRPFKTGSEMNKVMISKYNSMVDDNDTVYFIGDFVPFAKQLDSVQRLTDKLKGKKHLILGNHDTLKPFDYVEAGFSTVHTLLDLNYIVLVHDPATAEVARAKLFLCGHIHTLFKNLRNVINVGVDVWEFKPVSLEEILQLKKEMGFF